MIFIVIPDIPSFQHFPRININIVYIYVDLHNKIRLSYTIPRISRNHRLLQVVDLLMPVAVYY